MEIKGAERVARNGGPDPRPPLPSPRGPSSEALLAVLLDPPTAETVADEPMPAAEGGVLAEDFQLSLYLLYELHYRGLQGVDEAWEWHPGLLGFRGSLEADFEATLRELVPGPESAVDPRSVGESIMRLVAEDSGAELSPYLERTASADQFREFLGDGSAYQLKEPVPHSWPIPRLEGAAKAALDEVQADEYGGGRPEGVPGTLFGKATR